MQKKKANSRRRLVIGSLIALVLIAAFVGIRRSRTAGPEGTTYEFGTVERGDIKTTVSATGTVQPWKVVDVKSDVAGRIVNLAVDLGDNVQDGQLIAVIDPTDTRVAVEQATANLNQARARERQARETARVQPKITRDTIRQAESALEAAEKTLAQSRQSKTYQQQQLAELKDVTIPQSVEDARSDLEQARANVEAQQAEYNRQQELLEKGYSAKSEVEAAYARLATLQAALRTAQQRQNTLERQNSLAVKQLESQIAQTDATIQGNQARVKQQQAALEVARENSYQDTVREQDVVAARAQVTNTQAQLTQAATNLNYTRIVAPRSGVVLVKNVEQGTVVPSSRGSIGSTNALLQLGDMSRVWIVCQVDETDIGHVKVGQQTTVRVDAYPDNPQSGRVIRIDPQAVLEQNVTTIPVTVELTEPDPRFKPGMNAECEFVIAEVNDVLTVPSEALKGSPGEFAVDVLDDGEVVSVPVKTGLMGDDLTEVVSGLKPGQEVITRIIEPEDDGTNNPFDRRRPSSNQRSSGSSGSSGGGNTSGGARPAGGAPGSGPGGGAGGGAGGGPSGGAGGGSGGR